MTKKKVIINFHDLTRPILEVSLTDATMWKQPFSNKLLQLFDNVLPLGETRVVLRHEGDNFIHKTDHLGAAQELGKIVLAGEIGKNVESCTNDFRVEHLGLVEEAVDSSKKLRVYIAKDGNVANSEKFEGEEDDNRLVLVQLLHHDSLEIVLLDTSWDCLNKGHKSVHDFTLLGVFAHHVLHKA